MTRAGLALLLLGLAGAPARAQSAEPPPPPPPGQVVKPAPTPLPRLSAAAGVGWFDTGTSAGRERVSAFSLNADWRPLRDPLWGVRAQYAYGAIEDGTSLAHSKRATHLLTVDATRHWRATGSLYLFGGLGLGAALVHTKHEVGADDHVGLALEPAWSWTAGIELPFTRMLLRLDATGVWHQVSRDQIYALRLGARF